MLVMLCGLSAIVGYGIAATPMRYVPQFVALVALSVYSIMLYMCAWHTFSGEGKGEKGGGGGGLWGAPAEKKTFLKR